jgi:uncharacterized membrane protein (UPF0127 family)
MSLSSRFTRRGALAALAFGLAMAGGCSTAAEGPQTGLSVQTVSIQTAKGAVSFRCEVADTPERQETGLMFRREMAKDAGMIFIFPVPKRAGFWMHNTLIPLDLLFVDVTGRIESIAANARPLDDTVLPSRGLVKAVIEINGGEAAARGIAVGDRVTVPRLFPPA